MLEATKYVMYHMTERTNSLNEAAHELMLEFDSTIDALKKVCGPGTPVENMQELQLILNAFARVLQSCNESESERGSESITGIPGPDL